MATLILFLTFTVPMAMQVRNAFKPRKPAKVKARR